MDFKNHTYTKNGALLLWTDGKRGIFNQDADFYYANVEQVESILNPTPWWLAAEPLRFEDYSFLQQSYPVSLTFYLYAPGTYGPNSVCDTALYPQTADYVFKEPSKKSLRNLTLFPQQFSLLADMLIQYQSLCDNYMRYLQNNSHIFKAWYTVYKKDYLSQLTAEINAWKTQAQTDMRQESYRVMQILRETPSYKKVTEPQWEIVAGAIQTLLHGEDRSLGGERAPSLKALVNVGLVQRSQAAERWNYRHQLNPMIEQVYLDETKIHDMKKEEQEIKDRLWKAYFSSL